MSNTGITEQEINNLLRKKRRTALEVKFLRYFDITLCKALSNINAEKQPDSLFVLWHWKSGDLDVWNYNPDSEYKAPYEGMLRFRKEQYIGDRRAMCFMECTCELLAYSAIPILPYIHQQFDAKSEVLQNESNQL